MLRWPLGVGFFYYYFFAGKSAQEAMVEAAKIPALIWISKNLLPLIEIWPTRIPKTGPWRVVKGMGPLRFAGAVAGGYLLGVIVGWGISRTFFGKKGGEDFMDFVSDPVAAPGKYVEAMEDGFGPYWLVPGVVPLKMVEDVTGVTVEETINFVVPPEMRRNARTRLIREAASITTKIVRSWPQRYNPTGFDWPNLS